MIRQFREQISDNDRALVEAINTRLRLVAKLKSYKESRGIEFVDPQREEWILRISRARTAGRCPRRACGRSTSRSST